MIPKVSVAQFGNRYKIHIDGILTSFEKLIILCNCNPVKLRRMLCTEEREQGVVEAILKAENGVSFSRKTYWKDGVPMWIPLVSDVTGVCKVAAAYRIKQWLVDGNYSRMMRPKYLQRGWCDATA